MRHRNKTKHFNRHTAARVALRHSLVISIIENKSIETTVEKAKYIKPTVEKLITKAKMGDTLATRRYLLKNLRNNKKAVDTLIKDLGEKYKKRDGGYLKILKTQKRDGDKAKMAILSWVGGSKKQDTSDKAQTKSEALNYKSDTKKGETVKAAKTVKSKKVAEKESISKVSKKEN